MNKFMGSEQKIQNLPTRDTTVLIGRDDSIKDRFNFIDQHLGEDFIDNIVETNGPEVSHSSILHHFR